MEPKKMKKNMWVENTCGGVIYCGRSEKKCIVATLNHYATPYIHTAGGARPVVSYELDGEEDHSVGDVNESYDAFRARLANDLSRYGDRAYVP